MDNQLNTLLEASLSKSLHLLKERIATTTGASDRVNKGVWLNRSNIIVGYLSYPPGDAPSADSIDITFQLVPKGENLLEFTVDICHSDGEIMVEVIEQQIQYFTAEQAVSKVEQFSIRAVDEVADHLQALLSLQ